MGNVGRHRRVRPESRVVAKSMLGAATAAMAVLAIPTTASAAPSSATPQIAPEKPDAGVGTQSAGSGGRSGFFDDDQYQDIVARQKSNGALKVYPHADNSTVGVGTFRSAQPILGDTRGFRWIGQGDFNGDGFADIAGITPGGQLNVAINRGEGYKGPNGTLFPAPANSFGWNSTDLVFTGDVDGDGLDDVMARRKGTNSTYAYLNQGVNERQQPRFGAPVLLAQTTPGVVDQQLVDITEDTQPDLVSIKSNGEVHMRDYGPADDPDNPPQGTSYLIGTGFNSNNAFLFNDLDGDGNTDLVGRTADGTLRGYLHQGWDASAPRQTYAAAQKTLGYGWNSNDILS